MDVKREATGRSTIRGRVVASRFMESAAAVAAKRREEKESEKRAMGGSDKPRRPRSNADGPSRAPSTKQKTVETETQTSKTPRIRPIGAQQTKSPRSTRAGDLNDTTRKVYSSRQKSAPKTPAERQIRTAQGRSAALSARPRATRGATKPQSAKTPQPHQRTHSSALKDSSQRIAFTPRATVAENIPSSAATASVLGVKLLQWQAINALYEDKMQREDEVECEQMASLWMQVCEAQRLAARTLQKELKAEAERKASKYVEIIAPKARELAMGIEKVEEMHAVVVKRLVQSTDQLHLKGVTARSASLKQDLERHLSAASSLTMSQTLQEVDLAALDNDMKYLVEVLEDEKKELAAAIQSLAVLKDIELTERSLHVDLIVREQEGEAPFMDLDAVRSSPMRALNVSSVSPFRSPWV